MGQLHGRRGQDREAALVDEERVLVVAVSRAPVLHDAEQARRELVRDRGDRFDDQGKASPEYREARAAVVLGAGESRVLRIRCPFEPGRVVVDPDVNVLQLQRRAASVRL